MNKKCIVFLLFVLSFRSLLSQVGTLDFRDITTGDGLPSNNVLCITQDTLGFIWFGTTSGLCRYDGNDFKIYQHDPKNPEGLTWSAIFSLLVDSKGNFWIGTGGRGLNRFDQEQEKFIAYRYNENDSTSLSNEDYLETIYEDQQGHLWIGTMYGLNRYDEENDWFKRYTHNIDDPNSISPKPITCIFEDSKKNFWIGTDGDGLELFNRETGKVVHFRHEPENPYSISNNFVHSIFEDSESGLWIGTENGFDLLRYSVKKAVFKHMRNVISPNISNKKILDLYERKGSRKLISAAQQADFIDNQGNIWIGTQYDGAKFYNPLRDEFNTYKYQYDDKNGLKNRSVLAVCEESDGSLWIGVAHGGLHYYNRKKNTFKYLPLDPQKPVNPFDESITVILGDSYGDLWIGTWGKGLYKFDRKIGKSVHYMPDVNNPASLNCPIIRSIFEDSRQNIWIGTYGGGVNLYDRKNDDFISIDEISQVDTFSQFFELNKLVYKIYEDSQENIWIGTGSGLFLYDRDNRNVKTWKHNPGDTTTISGLHVQILYEDSKGNLWVGTWGGLNLFNQKNGTFTRYKIKDGLPSNSISDILEDDHGNLWISTDDGLSKFNPINKTFKNYNVNDGLQGNLFNQNACAKLKTGEFFFGGVNGFTLFHPDSIKDIQHIPPVVITDFQIFNKTVKTGGKNSPLKRSISLTNELILPYYQHSISFEFAVLDYTNPRNNQYKYKLEGFHKDWIETTADHRVATFTNLEPGKYVFRVIGANNKGVWNYKGASIKITITPPLWQTLWFRIIIVLFAAECIYAIHRYRLKRQLEMERMRIRIASDLHDDVGASLTRIAVHSEIIRNTSSSQKIIPSAKKIGEMSREIITAMSDIVWSIDARNDTVGDLIDRINDFASNTLSPLQIQFSFSTHGLNSSKKIMVDKRQNIYLIFKEAINNIAKHASASEVNIQIQNDEDGFRMSIHDNGKGIDNAQKQTGHGLKNMRMRAERIGGKLIYQSNQGTWIRFIMKSL